MPCIEVGHLAESSQLIVVANMNFWTAEINTSACTACFNIKLLHFEELSSGMWRRAVWWKCTYSKYCKYSSISAHHLGLHGLFLWNFYQTNIGRKFSRAWIPQKCCSKYPASFWNSFLYCGFIFISRRDFTCFYIFRTVHRVIYMWERRTRWTLYFLYLFQLYYLLHVSNK